MACRTLLLFAVVIAAGAPLAAQKLPSASKAWIKAPPAGASSTAAFVVIDNPTMYDVYVVSAQTDAAASVKFQKGSEGKAEPVEQLTAPAYDSIELKPDDLHMVLTGLTKPLKAGDKVTLVLGTNDGLALEVIADVKE